MQELSGAGENNIRFPGQYYDSETGLHYNYFRYYDPSTGRYITSDPIGIEGGTNSYQYSEANPLQFTDPFGLASKGGPYHSPAKTKCYKTDTCPVLKGKMHELQRMIKSHEGWDRHNPSPRGGGRHAAEIADFWRAYARCQSYYVTKKCKDCPPEKPEPKTSPKVDPITPVLPVPPPVNPKPVTPRPIPWYVPRMPILICPLCDIYFPQDPYGLPNDGMT